MPFSVDIVTGVVGIAFERRSQDFDGCRTRLRSNDREILLKTMS